MNRTKVLVSFDLPEKYTEKIKSVSSNIEIVKSKGKEEAMKLIADADVLFAGYFSKELFLAAKDLKWIQTFGAGVDRYMLPEVVNSQVTLTNAGGVHATPISEHVIGMMLCFCRNFHVFIRNQTEAKWSRPESWTSAEHVEELSGKTVGIIGLGKIGTELAKKAKCLGMKVVATKRDPAAAASTNVDRLVSTTDLNQLLVESNFVVLSLPLTKETEGMIAEEQLKKMKRTGHPHQYKQGKNHSRSKANRSVTTEVDRRRRSRHV